MTFFLIFQNLFHFDPSSFVSCSVILRIFLFFIWVISWLILVIVDFKSFHSLDLSGPFIIHSVLKSFFSFFLVATRYFMESGVRSFPVNIRWLFSFLLSLLGFYISGHRILCMWGQLSFYILYLILYWRFSICFYRLVLFHLLIFCLLFWVGSSSSSIIRLWSDWFFPWIFIRPS